MVSVLAGFPRAHADYLPFAPVKHVDDIVHDNEELDLHYPAFVRYEQVLDEIYVIDGRSRVIIYTHDLYPLFSIDRRDGIESPNGLAVDANGYVYVAQGALKRGQRTRISVYNPILQWERDIYFKDFEGAESFKPYRIAFDGRGNVLVAGIGYRGVLVLDREGNLREILSPTEDTRKPAINNVQVIGNRIFLISEEAGRIYVYDLSRSFLFAFGAKGGAPRHLSRPQSVAVDSTGRMFVTDYMRHVVVAYDKDGTWLFEFGGMGWGPGWFQFPKEIAIDKEDRIMVGDVFNNRIQIFREMSPEEIAEIKAQRTAKRKQKLPGLETLIPSRGVDISLGAPDTDDVSKILNIPFPKDDTSFFGPGEQSIIKKPGASIDLDEPFRGPRSDRTGLSLELGPLSLNLNDGSLGRGEGTYRSE